MIGGLAKPQSPHSESGCDVVQTRHEVMVPIGTKAFMPGELVHTNEVMVLLG